MTKEKAIDKVRKLRLLAAGAGNRAEAETAFGKAFDLIQTHNLTETDLALRPVPVGESHKYQAARAQYVHIPSEESELAGAFQETILDLFDTLKSALLRDLGLNSPPYAKHARRRRA